MRGERSSKQVRPALITLWGATGFTGALVAEALLARAADALQEGEFSLPWRIAGRNQEKLQRLYRRLAESPLGRAHPEALPTLQVAQLDDQESLDLLCAECHVLCSVVGPYARYGSPIVEACIRAGTDYCDLSGETHWMREMVDQHHAAAEAARVKIVHSCGFDSIPSDLAVLALTDALCEGPIRTDEARAVIRCYFGPLRGGLSGGTIASLIGALKASKDRRTRRILADPYALAPSQPRGTDRTPLSLKWVPSYRGRGGWRAPFMMAPVNEKIVHRSAALGAYQVPISYQEAMAFPRGLQGLTKALFMTGGLGLLIGLLSGRWTRAILAYFLPSPGEGPSATARARGHFALWAEGTLGHRDGEVEVKAALDPGYGGTALMLAEAALSLALDGEQTPARWGVLTPASALGMPLIERLERRGVTFHATVRSAVETEE